MGDLGIEELGNSGGGLGIQVGDWGIVAIFSLSYQLVEYIISGLRQCMIEVFSVTIHQGPWTLQTGRKNSLQGSVNQNLYTGLIARIFPIRCFESNSVCYGFDQRFLRRSDSLRPVCKAPGPWISAVRID